MPVFSGQKVQSEIFDKESRLTLLPQIDFRTIVFAVIDDVIISRFAGTAMTVQVLITASILYHGGRTVNCEVTKNLLVLRKHGHVVVNQKQ